MNAGQQPSSLLFCMGWFALLLPTHPHPLMLSQSRIQVEWPNLEKRLQKYMAVTKFHPWVGPPSGHLYSKNPPSIEV